MISSLTNVDIILNIFQYDGEIQVLYQVSIAPTLTNKKWSGKDLPIKAGEKLDVIVKAVDNKLICRNEDGKCEYLLLVYVFDTINITYVHVKYMYARVL